jgi:DNA polymerase III subunit delta
MILFFYGPNSYEARQQIARLSEQYRTKAGSDFGLDRIDGSRATLATIKASLQAVPFLANSRLVIIEQLGTNKTVAAKIDDIIGTIPSTTVAVFYEPQVDQRTIFFKDLSAKAKTVEYKLLDRPKLQRWISAQFESAGSTIERAAIGRLLDRAGEDQWRLSGEIAKLIDYCGDNIITPESVDQMVESSSTDTVFDLVEAVTAGRRQQALKLYQDLQTAGHHETYILSMVIWQLRNLLMAKTAGRMTPPQLAKAASMSPFVAGKALSKRHLFSENDLKAAFLEAVETDYQIKSGGGDSTLLLERLIIHLSDKLDNKPRPSRPL